VSFCTPLLLLGYRKLSSWYRVQNFLHHSSQFGFFLHVQKFREAIMGQSRDASLAAGLPDVVYLWAIHLSGSKELIAHEATYLSHALRATADTLSGQHHNTVLHSIQSEVLISLYFMRNMRFLEGKYVRSFAPHGPTISNLPQLFISTSAPLFRLSSAVGSIEFALWTLMPWEDPSGQRSIPCRHLETQSRSANASVRFGLF
jgi:hypothetical protein